MRTGIVYTETVLHTALQYQVAIIALDDGDRVTARIDGDRVAIDDRVAEIESRDGVPFFRKS